MGEDRLLARRAQPVRRRRDIADVLVAPDEVAMIRRTARSADRGVEGLLEAGYDSATIAEGSAPLAPWP
jgi:hypothetical protein